MTEPLLEQMNFLISQLEPQFRRSRIDEIDWQDRLIFIKGARGVGKTTLLLQYISEKFANSDKALYISMDAYAVSQMSLFEIAQYHFNNGGTHLFVDEIHKYENWSQELKSIYDLYKKKFIVVTGSSILKIQKGYADLSRRMVEYEIVGLSLREYVNIETGLYLPAYDLQSLLSDHVKIAQQITKQVNPLEYMKKYLEVGYYPYYLESKSSYFQKLNNTINLTIEIDLPHMLGVEIANVSKLKKLIYILATSVPYTINASKLSSSIELNRQTIITYINYLAEGKILSLLWNDGKANTVLTKPDKIYLGNPNMCYLLGRSNANVGTVRETFFINQLSYLYSVATVKDGDFLIDGKYTFEVGGMNKNFDQIANIKKSFIAADDILVGGKNKIPLWMFGFLY